MSAFEKYSKAGGSAYPVTDFPNPDGGTYACPGMTLRDYFAGQFLMGMAQSVGHSTTLYTDRMAKDAYDVADAMLEERQK